MVVSTETKECFICRKSKSPFKCGLCESALCKSCSQFLNHDELSFLTEIPKDLSHDVYCGPCFDQKVFPQVEAYNQTMESAKNVFVYYKAQSKETRLMKRSESPLQVNACADRDETVLRLAFLAVKLGFNAIIDVDLVSKKVRDGSYKILTWNGTAVPAIVDAEKLNRQ